MSTPEMESIGVELIYDGAGPVTWCRDPTAFGLQDKAGVPHVGTRRAEGTVVFDFHPRATTTGANIGGTRPMARSLP